MSALNAGAGAARRPVGARGPKPHWASLLPRLALAIALWFAATTITHAGEVARDCFAPEEDCAALIVGELAAARHEILVQAYSFTHRDIARALVDAKRRGVQVTVIVDGEQLAGHHASADYLARQGVLTLVDRDHAAAHNKVVLIDGHRTITGSFNFSQAAEKNAENLVVIEGEDFARRHGINFRRHLAHSIILN